MTRVLFSNFKKILKQENTDLNLEISLLILIKLNLHQNEFILLEIWIKDLSETDTAEEFNIRKEFRESNYDTLNIKNLSI